ncbi:hypothetical protein SHKM778_16230 [Streptomyces sp. KM77-8]|uniref:histidine kinase n=1 Tax=Streptomyces haneummycinicus TaxID=3074435 RepID=A0AAT9HCZ3_9ACTN
MVEDDATIVDAIATRLRAEGFLVQTAGDGPSAVDTAEAWQPDLLILDIMLPGFDGLEVCRRVQAQRPVPVMMLTARDDETDMLVGLGVGADDYMTKPFSMRELAARVHVLLRRMERAALAATTPRSGILRLGELEIDHAQRRVRVRGEDVHLTPTEFDLLVCLANTPRAVLSRSSCWPRSGTGRTPPAPARWTATSRRCAGRSAPSASVPCTAWATPWRRRRHERGPAGRGGPGARQPWGGVRPFSIKTKLGALVVVSVLITTGLSVIAVHTKTELRFITVFSMIATLLITQFVAHSLTAPLDDMNAVARSISHGDYTRRVRENRWDELGDLARTINVMADELEAQDRQRKELVANVSHELRTPIAGLRAVLENIVDGVTEADPETMRTSLKQTERLGRLVETLLDLSRLDNGVVPLKKRRFEVWPYLSGVLKEANMVSTARAGMASGSGGHTRTDVHLHLDVSPPELVAHADPERIHQVVANLIDNAVKHSPPHGRVTVRARVGAQRGSLELEVLDEGPAFRGPSGTGSSSASTGATSTGRTVRAATAAPDWAWRSPAGPSICTAAGSVWPNPSGAAASSSLFRKPLPYQVDVKFEAEPQDPSVSLLTDTCDQAEARAS